MVAQQHPRRLASSCRQALLVISLLLGMSCAVAKPLQAMGYLAWWMPQSWKNLPLRELDRLFFFELKVDATGTVLERHGWPEQWTELQQAAQQHQLPLDLTLTLFDSTTFNQLFTSPPAVAKLLVQCLELASHAQVSGLQLDVEIYAGAQAEAVTRYREFLGQLTQHLHALSPRRSVSVFMPVQTDAALYDAASLQGMDWVVAQSYDTHYSSSTHAGPVAPLKGGDVLTWESATAQALALDVAKERLVLTFPLYGYEWLVADRKLRSATQQPGQTTTFAEVDAAVLPQLRVNISQRVAQYGASHDPATGSAYYQYTNDQGQPVEGWFEDWWSLKLKTAFVKTEKLAGMAFFVLGYDRQELLHFYLQQAKPSTLDELISVTQ